MPAIRCGCDDTGCSSECCRRRSFGSFFPSVALLLFSALHLLLASIAYSRCGALPILPQNFSNSSRFGQRISIKFDRQQRLELRARQLEWEITRLRRELKSTTRAMLDVEQLCGSGGASTTSDAARTVKTDRAAMDSGNWASLRSPERQQSLMPSLADEQSVHSAAAPMLRRSRGNNISTALFTKRRMYNEFEVTPFLYFDEKAFTLLYNAERAVKSSRQRILADEQFQHVLDMARRALHSAGRTELGTSTRYSGQQRILRAHRMTSQMADSRLHVEQAADKERLESHSANSLITGSALKAETYSATLTGRDRPQLKCFTPCRGQPVATEDTPRYTVNFLHGFYGVIPQVGVVYDMMFTKDSKECFATERSQGAAAAMTTSNSDRQLVGDFTSHEVSGAPSSPEGAQCSSTSLRAVSILRPYGKVRVTHDDVVQIIPRHLVIVVVQGSDPDDEVPSLMSKFVQMFNIAWLGKDGAGSANAAVTSNFGNFTLERAAQKAAATRQTGTLATDQQRNWTLPARSTPRDQRTMPRMSTERTSFSKSPTMWKSVSLLIVVESKRAELLTRRATAEGKLQAPGNQQLNAGRTNTVTVVRVPRKEPASRAMDRILQTLQPALERIVPNLTRSVTTDDNSTTGATFTSDVEPLVLVTDARATFTADFLVRCAINSSPGRRVYYPIPFRLYNANLTQERPTSATQHSLGTENTISKFRGFWHVDDHSTSCSYWQDFLKVMLPSAGVEQQASMKKRSFAQRGDHDAGHYAEFDDYTNSAPLWLDTLFRLHAKRSILSLVRVPDPALVQPYRPIDCRSWSAPQQPADSSAPTMTRFSCWHARAVLEASHAQLGLLAFSDEIAQRQLTCCRTHENQNTPTDAHKHRRKQSEPTSTERPLAVS